MKNTAKYELFDLSQRMGEFDIEEIEFTTRMDLLSQEANKIDQIVGEVEQALELKKISNIQLIARFICRVRGLMVLLRLKKKQKIEELQSKRKEFILEKYEREKDVYKSAISRPKTHAIKKRHHQLSDLKSLITNIHINVKETDHNEMTLSDIEDKPKEITFNIEVNERLLKILNIVFFPFNLIGLAINHSKTGFKIIGVISWIVFSVIGGASVGLLIANLSNLYGNCMNLVYLIIIAPLLSLPLIIFFFNSRAFNTVEYFNKKHMYLLFP